MESEREMQEWQKPLQRAIDESRNCAARLVAALDEIAADIARGDHDDIVWRAQNRMYGATVRIDGIADFLESYVTLTLPTFTEGN